MFGAGTATVGAAPWVAAVLPAQLLAGAGNGVENVATDLLIQASAPPRLLGTISSVTIAVPFLASALAYSVAPTLLHAGGPRVTMLVAGLGVLTVATSTALLLRATPQLPGQRAVQDGSPRDETPSEARVPAN